MARELTPNESPVQLDTLAVNERLMLSLVRQHELTEATQLLNKQLQAEIDAREGGGGPGE